MWKIREWEKQAEETYWRQRSRMLSDTSRWAPHCGTRLSPFATAKGIL